MLCVEIYCCLCLQTCSASCPQQAKSPHQIVYDIPLAEVLHQAPALSQLLPTLAWKSLLCTSSALRQAIRCHVKTLRVPWPLEVSERAIQLLASGNWISLEVLDLSFTDLDAAGMKQLQKANWPKLQQLNVAGTQLCQEAIKQLSRGQWPDLEIVQLGHVDSYGLLSLQYLDNSNWPLLKSLQSPHMLLEHNALARFSSC